MSSEPKDPEADRPIVDDPAHLFGDGAANDDDFDLRPSDKDDPTPLEQQEDEVGPSTEDSEWVQEVRVSFSTSLFVAGWANSLHLLRGQSN